MAVTKEQKIDLGRCNSRAFFKELTLFADLPDEEVGRFSDASQLKFYKKGKHLYREGEQAYSFYIICTGWLRLFHTTEEGEELNLAVVTRKSTAGESAIFEQGFFASSAQVVEDAQILSVPLALLKEQIRLSNHLAFNMLTSMAQYQRRHELQLEQYFLYSAPQRIGCFLLGLCPVLEQIDGVKLDLPYDKALIASILGMKGATFSRALNILREETGIRIIGTSIIIDSMERLLKFVNGRQPAPHLPRDQNY